MDWAIIAFPLSGLPLLKGGDQLIELGECFHGLTKKREWPIGRQFFSGASLYIIIAICTAPVTDLSVVVLPAVPDQLDTSDETVAE